MTAKGDAKPGPSQASAREQSRFRRLLTAPWRQRISLDDLFPLVLLAFFPLLLPPPLENLVWVFLILLGIAIVLRGWSASRKGEP